ncbi:hypothetical protein TorRG33x02_038440 [Trema orientale]|uniref:Uncharacterized protein n=1 Tax=Trema orientale TaxID=63057 RepID=A0A2P5FRN2_TREOI|nr:hypothetical protein TorRG33x02_038440 [Trema orientale]
MAHTTQLLETHDPFSTVKKSEITRIVTIEHSLGWYSDPKMLLEGARGLAEGTVQSLDLPIDHLSAVTTERRSLDWDDFLKIWLEETKADSLPQAYLTTQQT